MLKGITLPNRQYDLYTPGEMDALKDLHPDTVVWPLYGGDIDQAHQVQLGLLSDLPGGRIKVIYRPYADNIPQRNPEQWADECLKRVSAMSIVGDIISDNERNLPQEQGHENWKVHASWLVRWSIKMGRKYSLHMGALSPSGNYIEGIKYFIDHKTYDYFDWIDWHIYDEIQLEVACQWAAKIIMPSTITEFNRLYPSEVLSLTYKSQTGKMISFADAVWFILGGTPDQHEYDITSQANKAYYDNFKNYTNTPVPAPIPSFDVGPGVKALMTRNKDVPVDKERYLKDTDGNVYGSETSGKKGIYKWNKSSMLVTFIPYGAVL